jgi:hypothetical protein
MQLLHCSWIYLQPRWLLLLLQLCCCWQHSVAAIGWLLQEAVAAVVWLGRCILLLLLLWPEGCVQCIWAGKECADLHSANNNSSRR